jgi:hypothetical protein
MKLRKVKVVESGVGETVGRGRSNDLWRQNAVDGDNLDAR